MFVGVTVYAYFMRSERQFYVLAAVVGTVQGGVQALSRSYFARLIPRERAGEYFGFYNMLGQVRRGARSAGDGRGGHC